MRLVPFLEDTRKLASSLHPSARRELQTTITCKLKVGLHQMPDLTWDFPVSRAVRNRSLPFTSHSGCSILPQHPPVEEDRVQGFKGTVRSLELVGLQRALQESSQLRGVRDRSLWEKDDSNAGPWSMQEACLMQSHKAPEVMFCGHSIEGLDRRSTYLCKVSDHIQKWRGDILRR